jgi:hypothetical protein
MTLRISLMLSPAYVTRWLLERTNARNWLKKNGIP